MKLILLGPPAAGKGTQAECIAERYSLAHISTGDMLRAEISKKTPLGLRAKALIDDGNLVPDEIINEMVLSRIQHEDCSIGFLLDGYPRIPCAAVRNGKKRQTTHVAMLRHLRKLNSSASPFAI